MEATGQICRCEDTSIFRYDFITVARPERQVKVDVNFVGEQPDAAISIGEIHAARMKAGEWEIIDRNGSRRAARNLRAIAQVVVVAYVAAVVRIVVQWNLIA